MGSPGGSTSEAFVPLLASIIGWIYFLAWSISFYPQVILNYQRKTVEGLSFDYLSLNLLGFTCYSLYNGLLYFNKTVQADYHDHYGDSPIPVETTDVAFAFHALLLVTINICQCIYYPKGKTTQFTWFGKTFSALGWVGVTIAFLVTISSKKVDWLTFIEYCGYTKLGCSLLKYNPQLYLNWSRKATVGWSIYNILLDLTGGIGSFLQQGIMAVYTHNAGVIFGNLPKFGLALLSITYDVLFIIQHYVLYKDANTDEKLKAKLAGLTKDSEEAGLVEGNSPEGGGGEKNLINSTKGDY